MPNDAGIRAALTRPAVGLGCATFGSTVSVPESVRVIAAAVEGGVRHLDVARSYGYGQAETAVGRFLRSADASDVTITTKAGISPPGGIRQVKALRVVARAVADLNPALKRRIARAASAGVASSRFGLDDLASSFEQSLRALAVDRVDVLLLHECAEEDLTDEVLDWLERRCTAGQIGLWGTATDLDRAAEITATRHVPVVQTSAALGVPLPSGVLERSDVVVRHSMIRASIGPLGRLLADPAARRRAEEALGLPLAPEDVVPFLLALALAQSPGGLVLAGTRRAEHARRLGGVVPLDAGLVPAAEALLRSAGV